MDTVSDKSDNNRVTGMDEHEWLCAKTVDVESMKCAGALWMVNSLPDLGNSCQLPVPDLSSFICLQREIMRVYPSS